MTELSGASGRAHPWFRVFVVACLVGAGAFIARRQRVPVGQEHAEAVSGATAAEASQALGVIRARPHVYYRSVRPGEFGRVVVAALEAPDDKRVVTGLSCDRVDFGVRRGICLADGRNAVGAPAEARIYDSNFTLLGAVPLAGTPIRTRLSPDERIAAATVFVTGERYDADFTTRTTLIDTQTMAVLGELEQFDAQRNGRRFSRIDFNYWGVTFTTDSDQFFATLGYTGARFLVRGDLATRQLRVIRDNVECPALSPDERLIAFKSRVPGSSEWRPHVLDLGNDREWAIPGEGRNIDDQIEWLDSGHVLYQFTAERGLPEEAVNVWMSAVAADSHEGPKRFIRAATSPAVVRP